MKPTIAAAVRLCTKISFIILILPAICTAADVTLQWDPNIPAPQGYRLYYRTAGQPYDYTDYIDTGQSTTQTVTDLEEDTTYFFVVRAYVGQDLSGDSNEVAFNSSWGTGGPPPTQGTVPPDQPYTIEPADNAQDVSLQPRLVSGDFYDEDTADYHSESRWQVFRMDNDLCVLDMTSQYDLTRLRVPSNTLEELTTYYWTVQYISQSGEVSLPAEEAYFTTGYHDSGTSLSNNSSSGGSGGGGSGGCFLQSMLD